MTKLLIIVGSVRPGRIGIAIAEWARDLAAADGRFDVDFADLAALNLPFMDEPNHPRFGKYTKEHTIGWSRRVAAADAILVVMPEYNHSYSPALKNALDYLYAEWNRKPVGFVAYGGASGGTRALMAITPVIACLGMVRATANLEVHGAGGRVVDGVFAAEDRHAGALTALLTELDSLAGTLTAYRVQLQD